MFTGLVETIGEVKAIRSSGSGKVVSVDVNKLAQDIKLGDSVAVNGVCLTATKLNNTIADFDVSGETLNRSTIGKLRIGAKVNLELAMAANGRFGGHIVQGHVDGLAKLKRVDKKGDFYDVIFSAGSELLDNMVEKGSVAINGISLTVASMDKDSFTIAVIPVTWEETTLRFLNTGDEVNIETDVIVKVVKKQLSNMLGDSGSITIDKLKSMGF